jgi:integrase
MPLTDKQVRNAKRAAKPYKKSDAGGLYVMVMPNGAKRWRLAYRWRGKQRTLPLGLYPAITLADARQARTTAKGELANGVDPSAARKERTRAARIAAETTFEAVAREWHESQKTAWSAEHAETVMRRLATDVFPAIGHRPVASIEPSEVLDLLRGVESCAIDDTAHRLQRCVSTIFRFAIATGRGTRDASAEIKGALKARPAKPRNHRVTPPFDLRSFLRALGDYDGEQITRLALGLVVLTLVETTKLRAGRWDEVEGLDGPEPLWRIPAERMTSRRAHLVPLSRQAAYVLRELRKLAGDSPFMFPSTIADGCMSENRYLSALHRMGYHSRATNHDLRGVASTALNENGFDSDRIQHQLAHIEDKASCAIDGSAEWLPQRRHMMQWWADHLDWLLVEADSAEPLALAS